MGTVMRRRVLAILRLQTALTLALALTAVLAASSASAQTTIKRPGDRVRYSFEAEPHLLLTPFGPPEAFGDGGLGLGFRGTIEIVKNGFVPSINNSVGISFGGDWLHYPNASARGPCTDTVTAPGGIPVCVEVDGSGYSNYLFLPIAMEWNFWLSRRWSVFAEPGFAPHFAHGDFHAFQPALYLGGRYLFGDRVALTMRVGYPTFSIGVSFLP